MTQPARLSVVPVGPVACAATFWRERGRARVTAIVKATFSFAHDGPMPAIAPSPLVEQEIHHHHDPSLSVVATSDFAPHRQRVDVLLVGHACAPGGTPTQRLKVRLCVHRGGPLLDKVLEVVGDQGNHGIAPFARMPLTYEHAFGGNGHAENPLGKGVGAAAHPPNLVDPARPMQTAGFGPISETWPVRRRLLTLEQRRAVDTTPPEIDEGFDWAYFQAAPRDQQLHDLAGDEWLILEGVHATRPRIEAQLPGVRASARLYGLGAETPLLLRADTLYIDADAERCTVTFRAGIPVPAEVPLAELRLAAGVELHGAPVAWPDVVAAPKVALGAPLGRAAVMSTMEIDDSDLEVVEVKVPLPATTPNLLRMERTLVLDGASAAPGADPAPPRAESLGAVPSGGIPPGEVPIGVVPAHPIRAQLTVSLPLDTMLAETAQRDPLPFQHQESPEPHAPSRGTAALPGAPWSPEHAVIPPRLNVPLNATMDLAAAAAPAPAPAPEPVHATIGQLMALGHLSPVAALPVLDASRFPSPERSLLVQEPAFMVSAEPIAPQMLAATERSEAPVSEEPPTLATPDRGEARGEVPVPEEPPTLAAPDRGAAPLSEDPPTLAAPRLPAQPSAAPETPTPERIASTPPPPPAAALEEAPRADAENPGPWRQDAPPPEAPPPPARTPVRQPIKGGLYRKFPKS
ncbi:DUF2169 family type VI secretion system accessory protein [Chondromyces apiculatus]|uniref:DUF2169 domain-containing protein n=1 Tax=Chondromyces apiculatus DSM 436 TaxID=1192034 RepID=A0A017T8X6_9BACT|nr:DUF2169 domain-containing protein [Chondromyces apiculatus]EYF05689.1 Hypothetical protein CAP_2979 [Chondromyces apiculatus DSM 436]